LFLILIISLFSTSVQAADGKIYQFTNSTAFVQSDLHLVFTGTGGSLALTVLTNPPGCPAPTIMVTAPEVWIDWGVSCIAPGAIVVVQVNTANGPLDYNSGTWTRPNPGGGPQIEKPIDPKDVKELCTCPPPPGSMIPKTADCDGDGVNDWHMTDKDMPDGRGGTIEIWCIDKGAASYFLAKLKNGGVTKYIGKCPFGGGKNQYKKKFTGGKLTKFEWWSVDDEIPDADKNYRDYHVTTTFTDTGCSRDISYTGQDPTGPLCIIENQIPPEITTPQPPNVYCCTSGDIYCDELPTESGLMTLELVEIVETIPTLSQWGLILLALLLLTFSTMAILQRQPLAASTGSGNAHITVPSKALLFDSQLYWKTLPKILLLVPVVLLLFYFVYGFITTADVLGTVISAGIITYWIQLILVSHRN